MAVPSPPLDRTILILGASYAGLSTTHYLLRHVLPFLPTSLSYKVLLVSSAAQVMCRPACPRALISDDFFDQNKLFVDIRSQLEQYPEQQWTFVHGTVSKVDLQARVAIVQSSVEHTVPFHALVIATGASTLSPLLGLHNGESALREAWTSFRTCLPAARSIVIAGAGPAGVEVAGELSEYINGRIGWFASSPKTPKTTITLVTSGERILPALRPSIAAVAECYLARLGVVVMAKSKVVSVEPADAGSAIPQLTTPVNLSLSTGETLTADLYIQATGTRPSTSFLSPTVLAPDGRVTTNPQTLRVDTASPLIYSIGDCSNAFCPAIHNIMAAVPVLCNNIHHDLIEASDPGTRSSILQEKCFKEDMRETQLVPIGTKKGVGAAMGYKLPSWLVWLIKGRDYWIWTTGRLWSGRQW
ncbi:FAD/NAD(P)-binding domain-containing protein [Setomelanomma holmii]|uniref:FAD/NAD(P)-binding domain-containing protein n=1 Tax=Setomelanomma holmii TaxID=210430 RepID=A0A9P4H4M4_9PLEO|nr:FAD/NAD(P)-binding domain-containing protein [Setomelanomma holmii]